MVKSNINPDKVSYREIKDIDNEDIGYESTIYEYDLFNKTIEIALGKPKYTYTNHSIIYYPIYFVLNNKIISNIGAFEIDSNKLIDILDEAGDVSLEKGEIILFSFVTGEYIHSKLPEENIDIAVDDIEKNKISKEHEDEDEDEDEDEVTRVVITDKAHSNKTEKSAEQDPVFRIDENKKIPLSLQEETKEQSNAAKNEYTVSNRNKWVEDFMKNNNYNIIENEGNGDCFFSVIRDAFDQIGKITTVDTLRQILVKEVNDEIYQQYRTLYVNFLGEMQSKEKEMKTTKKIIAELKKRSERTKDKKEIQDILNEANAMVKQYDKLKLEKEDVKELMDEFKFMEGVDTFEKFSDFIKTSDYWADTWAISTFEKVLNIKIIILSQEAYQSGD